MKNPSLLVLAKQFFESETPIEETTPTDSFFAAFVEDLRCIRKQLISAVPGEFFCDAFSLTSHPDVWIFVRAHDPKPRPDVHLTKRTEAVLVNFNDEKLCELNKKLLHDIACAFQAREVERKGDGVFDESYLSIFNGKTINEFARVFPNQSIKIAPDCEAFLNRTLFRGTLATPIFSLTNLSFFENRKQAYYDQLFTSLGKKLPPEEEENLAQQREQIWGKSPSCPTSGPSTPCSITTSYSFSNGFNNG